SYGSGDCTRIESLADTSLPPVQAYFSGNCALIANDLTQANQHYETAVKDSLIAPYAAINAIWLTINTGDETAARAQITTRLATDYISRRASVEQADLLAYRARLYALLFDYSTAIADLTAAL